MINPRLLRQATRLQRAYAESFAVIPHYRARGYVPAPRSLGYSLVQAYREVQAIDRAHDLGWSCEHEPESRTWDGDCEAPGHLICLIVRDEDGNPLASLGMVGVNSLDDPYLTTVEAELYAEALDTHDSEHADELSARATYAGVSQC